MIDYSYFTWFATLYLIILTVQDFKDNKWVDDRRNYFMMGIAISLFSHIPRNLWYILALIVLTIGLNIYLKHFKIMGEADISTISWLFMGLAIIDLWSMVWFFAFLSVITFLFLTIKNLLFKAKNTPAPYYSVLLITWLFHSILFGLW